MKRHWSEETQWTPLSEAVGRIKREVERAYYECREDDADAAHQELICVEWRLRQAERRRAK